MNWQDYTTWAVVAVAVGVALWRITRLVCGAGRGGCSSCTSADCPLKNLKKR